jgi:hypothetical protein
VLLFSIVAVDHFQSLLSSLLLIPQRSSVLNFFLILQKWQIFFAEKTQVLHHIKNRFFSSVSQILLAKLQGLAIKKSLEITRRKNSEP